MKFLGQKGQDRWVVEEVFHSCSDGFFVDLAASDGLEMNNTLVLERELGWRGIAIEAQPEYFEQLKLNRRCVCVPACVDADEHTVEFLPSGLLGGIIDDETDNSHALRAGAIREAQARGRILKMKTRRLENILSEYNAPAVIDYLSFDVEGAETRILRRFPFDRYKFLSMTIERPTPALNEILFRNGYLFVRNVQFDTFYVHQSIPNVDQIRKEPFAQVPPTRW
jgi:FkbM family methyltransferase